jgi:RimJ/RimL family protein N-acetyltransferase
VSATVKKYLTKDGKSFIIRRPTEDDAENIIAYTKTLFFSTDQVLTTLEEYTITIEAEKMWISSFKENPDALVLVAEIKNQIIGLLFFISNSKRKTSHTGEFGLSVHPRFQGIGIGRTLIELLLSWAKQNIKIEKVYLTVLNTNHQAIQLYKNLGFVEEGRQVKGVKQLNGEYADIIQMYIETK